MSVALPAELRTRVQAEAKRRGLTLARSVRALLSERIAEIDDVERLSRAEEWQRAEAWATWERFLAGDRREVSKEQLDADFAEARRRAEARRSA